MEKLWRPQGVNPYYLKGGRKPPGLLLSVLQNSGATLTESKCSKSGLLTTGHKLQHPIPKISELWEHIAAPSGAIRAQDSTEQIKQIWRQLLPFCWSDLKTRRASLERVDQGACQRKYNFFFFNRNLELQILKFSLGNLEEHLGSERTGIVDSIS